MKTDDAVSTVVGEMLMIALVVVLIASVTVALPALLPADRFESANILTVYDAGNHTLSLYHKGGDWLTAAELTVTASMGGERKQWSGESLKITPYPGLGLDAAVKKQTFDLGDVIVISGVTSEPSNVKMSTATTLLVTTEGI